MSRLNKIAKSILKYVASPLAKLIINISKRFKTIGNVSSFILHDVPNHQIKTFKELLIHLKNEYKFLDPKDLKSFFNGDLTLRNKHLLLTFDDGFFSNYRVALEVLDELEINAIFFIPTGFIDSKTKESQEIYIKKNLFNGEFPSGLDVKDMRPMSWENLSELVNMGHIIGSHSKNHLRLSKINDNDLLKEEIISSGDRIEEILGIEVQHFAFPFGDIKSISKKALQIIKTRDSFVYSGIRGPNNFHKNPLVIRRGAFNITDSIGYNIFLATEGLSFYYWIDQIRLDRMAS